MDLGKRERKTKWSWKENQVKKLDDPHQRIRSFKTSEKYLKLNSQRRGTVRLHWGFESGFKWTPKEVRRELVAVKGEKL